MVTFHILIGPPGIGKTTYCRQRMGESDVRVSMDDLQTMMGGGHYGNYRTELKSIYRRTEHLLILEALSQDRDVWLDRTNMSSEGRRCYIEMASESFASRRSALQIRAVNFMAFWLPNDSWLLDRRMQDDRDISKEQWAGVIHKMLGSYDLPTLAEGFDDIVDIGLEEVT